MKTAIKRFLQGNESYDSAQTLITVFMPCKRTLSLSAALQNILTVGLSIVQRRLTGLNLICYVQLIVQKLFLSLSSSSCLLNSRFAKYSFIRLISFRLVSPLREPLFEICALLERNQLFTQVQARCLGRWLCALSSE